MNNSILIFSILLLALLAGCDPQEKEAAVKPSTAKTAVIKSTDNPVKAPALLTEADWRARLTPEQYRVLRQAGTEPSGTGELLHEERKGTYHCAACGAQLFASGTKYDACGWPSFYDALPGTVELRSDGGAQEAICVACKSHLGHLFDDGPQPTGNRY